MKRRRKVYRRVLVDDDMNRAIAPCPHPRCFNDEHAIQKWRMDGIFVESMVLYCLSCETIWEYWVNYSEDHLGD